VQRIDNGAEGMEEEQQKKRGVVSVTWEGLEFGLESFLGGPRETLKKKEKERLREQPRD